MYVMCPFGGEFIFLFLHLIMDDSGYQVEKIIDYS